MGFFFLAPRRPVGGAFLKRRARVRHVLQGGVLRRRVNFDVPTFSRNLSCLVRNSKEDKVGGGIRLRVPPMFVGNVRVLTFRRWDTGPLLCGVHFLSVRYLCLRCSYAAILRSSNELVRSPLVEKCCVRNVPIPCGFARRIHVSTALFRTVSAKCYRGGGIRPDDRGFLRAVLFAAPM